MIVVDTHAVLWMTHDRALLSFEARRVLGQGRTEGGLAIADITLREVADQVTRGRVTLRHPLTVYLKFLASLFQVIPISAEIAERSAGLGPPYPKDPADRLIGATALVHGAVLVTRDERIRRSGAVSCVW